MMKLLKRYFKEKELPGDPSRACLGVDELHRWSEGRLEASAREKCLEHAALCPLCLQKITALSQLKTQSAPSENPPDSVNESVRLKLKSMEKRSRGSAGRRRFWVLGGLSGLFFALSFFYTRYFIQWVLLAALFALAALLERHRSGLKLQVWTRASSEAEEAPNGRRTASEKLKKNRL